MFSMTDSPNPDYLHPLLFAKNKRTLTIPEIVEDMMKGWSDEDISAFILCLFSEALDRPEFEDSRLNYIDQHGLPLAEELALLCDEVVHPLN